MIIRRRTIRTLSKHRPLGQVGMKTMQRSLAQARRMLISRVPEQAPADWQSAMNQPLNWSNTAALPDPNSASDALPLDSGSFMPPAARRAASPAPASMPSAASTPSSAPVQRSAEADSDQNRDLPAMPADLQAIYNMHKAKGRIDSGGDNESFLDRIRKNKGSQPANQAQRKVRRPGEAAPPPAGVRRADNAPVQRVPTPSQDATSQTGNAEDDFPIVAEPQPRRVRSRIDYVNVPSADQFQATPPSSSTGQVQRAADTPAADDTPDEVDIPAELLGDDMPATDEFDFADGDTASAPTNWGQASADTPANTVQRALSDAERANPPSMADTTDAPRGQSINPPASPINQTQRTADQTLPPQQSSGQASIQRAPDMTSPTAHATPSSSPNVPSHINDRTSDDSEQYTQTLVDMPAVRPSAPAVSQQAADDNADTIQRAIARAERPDVPSANATANTTYDNMPADRPSAPRGNVPSVPSSASGMGQPAAIQAQRDDDEPALSYGDDDFFGLDPSERLPEQDMDLGAALFGEMPTAPSSESLMKPDASGNAPVVMPPIGKAHHRTRPSTPSTPPPSIAAKRDDAPTNQAMQQTIQRAEDPHFSIDADFATLIDTPSWDAGQAEYPADNYVDNYADNYTPANQTNTPNRSNAPSSPAVQRAVDEHGMDDRFTASSASDFAQSSPSEPYAPTSPTSGAPSPMASVSPSASVQRSVDGSSASPTPSPISTMQRDMAIQSAIQRAESPDPMSTKATADEANLLSLLDMPADTPIQRGGGSMPSIQASFDDGPMSTPPAVGTIQRLENDDSGSGENQPGQPSQEQVNDMANKVYSILKRRLKVEQERLRGKK